MIIYRLGEVEMKFATLIWEHEPLTSRELAVLAEQELQWNRSTTYTILRRICQRGLFANEKGRVTSLVSKQEFLAGQSEDFVNDTFGGSLPHFFAAFASRKKLTAKEIEELRELIDQHS